MKRYVNGDAKTQNIFEVLEGLKPSDRVITSSYEKFEDHDSVDLREI